MIVSIHQPNFMPWYPFFQKIEVPSLDSKDLYPPLADPLMTLVVSDFRTTFRQSLTPELSHSSYCLKPWNETH